jgi:hypothetical protein
MNLNYQHLLPQDFNEDSRVWIYQCNRVFTLSEVLEVEAIVEAFAANCHRVFWTVYSADGR